MDLYVEMTPNRFAVVFETSGPLGRLSIVAVTVTVCDVLVMFPAVGGSR